MTSDALDRKPAVLYVDDEPQALKYFGRLFGDEFRIVTALSVAEARQVLSEQGDDVAIVFTDQRMPGETGVSLLEYLRMRHPSVLRILTTAYTDLKSAVEAVNAGGAYQYVEKPWDLDALRIVLRRAMERFELQRERDGLVAQKATAVQASLAVDRTRALAAAAAALSPGFRGTLKALRDYLRDARVAEREAFPPRHFADDELWSQAAFEGPRLVAAVAEIASVLQGLRETDPPEPLTTCLERAGKEANAELGREGVVVELAVRSELDLTMERPARFRRLIHLLAARLSDADGEELKIRVAIAPRGEAISVEIVAEGREWSAELAAALYSLGIVRCGGLMGSDMDLFAAYVLATDLGAALRAPEPGRTPARFSIDFSQPVAQEDEEIVRDLFWEAAASGEALAVPSAD